MVKEKKKSPSVTEFVRACLFSTRDSNLSYSLKFAKLIEEHLLNLLSDFPDLSPSYETFTHNDGTTVNLMKVSGNLKIFPGEPPISITIWLHQSYPSAAPIVFVDTSPWQLIGKCYPFINSSREARTPYLESWRYPGSNLSAMVRNLRRVFRHCQPLSTTDTTPNICAFFPSKQEAIDRLSFDILTQLSIYLSEVGEDVNTLLCRQATLVERSCTIDRIQKDLNRENRQLKQKVKDITEASDVLMNWLRVHDPESAMATSGNEWEIGFELVDDDSRLHLESSAEELAIEDVIQALDPALEQKKISFEDYIKKIRQLAREQFYCKLKKIQGRDIALKLDRSLSFQR